MTTPDLATVREFAQLVRASEGTVYNWVRAGVIPVWKVRHYIRIPRAAALEVLAAGAQKEAEAEKETVAV
jgi:excisionase family DNA binding protein